MSKIVKLYKGTGAALTLGLGFLPKRVRITAVGGNTVLDWDANSNLAGKGGIVTNATVADNATTIAHEVLAAAAGVVLFFGGEQIGSASASKQVDASAIAAYQGSKQGGTKAWTLGNATNMTGSFDVGVDTDYIGVGSRVAIYANGKLIEARIIALTNDGDGANEVTLDRAVPSGTVVFIGCNVDFAACPVGFNMPDGITINDTTYVNTSGSLYSIEAE